MRILVGLIILFIIATNSLAQNIDQSNIPAVVVNSFQLKYPNAESVNWKLVKGNYQLDFKINGKLNQLTLDYKGMVLKHSQDLYISEVPGFVNKAIRKRLSYFDIHDADKYEIGDSVVYEIRFKSDGNNQFFWVNKNGEIVKYRKELNETEIPQPIFSYIANELGAFEFDRAKYVEENGKIIYIIRGEINNRDYVITIDDKVILLKLEYDIKENEIPKAIIYSLNDMYSNYDIRDADLVKENEKIRYILRIRKSGGQNYLIFDQNGNKLDLNR